MWDFLPVSELHKTTNYGCAGGVCEGRYQNIYHTQAAAGLAKIEREITALRERDPSGYYESDMDELLASYRELSERMRQPFS